MSKCFCHLNGFAVKDENARRRITVIEEELEQGYVKPEGTLPITEVGKHNVAQYEEVDVQIEPTKVIIPEGYVKPEGVKKITKVRVGSSTTHNVAGYKEVNIQLSDTPLVIDDLSQNGQLIDVENYRYVLLKIATFDGEGEA